MSTTMTEGVSPSTPSHKRGRALRIRIASWTGGHGSPNKQQQHAAPTTPTATATSSFCQSPIKKTKSYIHDGPKERVERSRRKSDVNDSLKHYAGQDVGDTSGQHHVEDQRQSQTSSLRDEQTMTPLPPLQRSRSQSRRSITTPQSRSRSTSRPRRSNSRGRKDKPEPQQVVNTGTTTQESSEDDKEGGNDYDLPVSVRKLRPPSCARLMDDYDNETCDPTERTSTSSLSQYTQQLGSEKSLLSSFSAAPTTNDIMEDPGNSSNHRELPLRTRSDSEVPKPSSSSSIVTSTSRRRRRSTSRRRSRTGTADKGTTTTNTTTTTTTTRTRSSSKDRPTQDVSGAVPRTPSIRRRTITTTTRSSSKDRPPQDDSGAVPSTPSIRRRTTTTTTRSSSKERPRHDGSVADPSTPSIRKRTSTATTRSSSKERLPQDVSGAVPSTPSNRRRSSSMRRLKQTDEPKGIPDALLLLEGSTANVADHIMNNNDNNSNSNMPMTPRPQNIPRSKSSSQRRNLSSSVSQQEQSLDSPTMLLLNDSFVGRQQQQQPSSSNLQESLTLNSLVTTSAPETPRHHQHHSSSMNNRSSMRGLANSQESLSLGSLTATPTRTPTTVKVTSSFSRRNMGSRTSTTAATSTTANVIPSGNHCDDQHHNISTPVMERSTSLLSRRSLSSSLGSLKTATSNTTSHTLKSPQPAPLAVAGPITPSRRHVPNVTRKRAERNRAIQELSEEQAVTDLLERVLSRYPRQKCRTLDEHQQEAKKELSRQKDELCASLHSQQQQQQQLMQGEGARTNEQKERVTLQEQLEFTHCFSEKNRGNSQVTAVTDNRSTDDSSALLLSTETFEEVQCILEEKLAAKFAEEASTVADSHLVNDNNDNDNTNLEMKSDNKQKNKDVSLNTKNANSSSDEDEDESVVLVLAPSESPSIGQFMRKSLLGDKDPKDNKTIPALPVMSPCFGRHIRKSLPLHDNDTATPSLQHHLKRESHPSFKPKRKNGDDSKKNAFCYPAAPAPPLPPHKGGMASDHVLLCLDETTTTPPSSKPPIPSTVQPPPDKDLVDFFREAAAGNGPCAQLPSVQLEDRTMDDFLRQAVEEQAAAVEVHQEALATAPIAPTKKHPDHKPSLDSLLRKLENQYIVETSSTGRRVGKYTGTVCKKSGKPHGIGSMIYPGANGSESSWYKGNWIQGEWSGYGTHQKANGDVYQGEFLHHAKHGQGLYRYRDDKRTFEGRYVRGERVEGRMTYADGSVYEGQWQRGKRHGRGSYVFCDGSVYDGEFERDQMHGTGQLTWPEPGGAFVGGWCRGQRHGRGREWDAHGKLVVDGMWNDGVPVEQN